MHFSVLNLVPLREGESYAQAYEGMIRLAQKVEELGYERYWLAEHHNSSTIGSTATAQLIQHTLSQTSHIRVGSGGVMLPNHNPYVIAEQYATLDVLYPGRIDLGLGRAPGTDAQTAQALRRQQDRTHLFPAEVRELLGYFQGTNPVQAYPAVGREVPLYILGSSTDSAYLAAELGLPYAFAAHFAPAKMVEAIHIYRRQFKASAHLTKPYVILCANAAVADTDEEARSLATSQTRAFLNLVTGQQKGLQPPVAAEEVLWEERLQALYAIQPNTAEYHLRREQAAVQSMLKVSLIGALQTVEKQIETLLKSVEVDEWMINSYIYDEVAQHRSYELLAELFRQKE